MAIPREGDDGRLKRVARYLHGNPDYLQWYPIQEERNTVVLSTDADWATCKETRRSNSGGTLQLGDHLIAAWSRVQPRIALSSGEAEVYAGMRGISETLGFVHLMREFKSNDWGRIVHHMLRRGCGGLKQITVRSLGFKKPCVSTLLKLTEFQEMRCMLTSLPLHPEELRKHLTMLNAYRDGEAEV